MTMPEQHASRYSRGTDEQLHVLQRLTLYTDYIMHQTHIWSKDDGFCLQAAWWWYPVRLSWWSVTGGKCDDRHNLLDYNIQKASSFHMSFHLNVCDSDIEPILRIMWVRRFGGSIACFAWCHTWLHTPCLTTHNQLFQHNACKCIC